MLRTIAISLMLVLSVGIMLPFANEAHGVRQTIQVGQRRHHRYRSRAWWRRYRARLRQKRLAAELAHRNKLLSLPQNISVGDLSGLSRTGVAVNAFQCHCRNDDDTAAASDDGECSGHRLEWRYAAESCELSAYRVQS